MGEDLAGLIVLLVEGGAVALVLGAVIARRAFLHGNQRDFGEGERTLEAAGFHVERVTEEGAGGIAPTPTTAPPAPLTRALVASCEGARMRVERTRRGARCTLHVGPVRAVSRATFAVRRQAWLAGDIKVGDARFDAALHVDGWPTDRVRAIVGQPAVRAALDQLFGHDLVKDVALVAHGEGGAVRVKLTVPWARLATLRDVVDDAKRLAAALDEAMWVDAELEGKRVDLAELEAAAAGVEGGLPVAVPVKR